MSKYKINFKKHFPEPLSFSLLLPKNTGRSWLLLVSLVLLVSACKKTELPLPVNEDPVFSVSGQFGNQEIQLTAGEEDYYLFTSFTKDSLDVFSFIGRFATLQDCVTNCQESLEFEIRDYERNPENSIIPGESLGMGTYNFVNRQSTSPDTILEGYEVLFIEQSTANIPLNYFWDFGDGTTSLAQNPDFHFYPVSQNLIPEVALRVTGQTASGICEGIQLRTIDLEAATVASDCNLALQISSDSLETQLCAAMSGNNPNYQWEYDTLYFGECLNIPNNLDSLTIYLRSSNGANCMRSIDIQLQNSPVGGYSYCAADFLYEVNKKYAIEPDDPLNLSQVIIRYTDSSGILYTSDGGPQAAGQNFQILESSEYLINENGALTRLLEVQFSCRLYNETGEWLNWENGRGVIAVAYPGN